MPNTRRWPNSTCRPLGRRRGDEEDGGREEVECETPERLEERRGQGGEDPMTVPAGQLRSLLGISSVTYNQGKEELAIIDTTLADA